MSHDAIIDLYERHAGAFDRDCGRSLPEQHWLDRFLALVPAGGSVLDVGCGMGEPMAAYVIGPGFTVTGVDASQAMIAMCRARFAAHEHLENDPDCGAPTRAWPRATPWPADYSRT